MKLFNYRDVSKLVGIDNNSINNSNSQQSNLSIQAIKMNWSETKYLPGLPKLPSTLTSTLTTCTQEMKRMSVTKNPSRTELSQLKLNYFYDS